MGWVYFCGGTIVGCIEAEVAKLACALFRDRSYAPTWWVHRFETSFEHTQSLFLVLLRIHSILPEDQMLSCELEPLPMPDSPLDDPDGKRWWRNDSYRHPSQMQWGICRLEVASFRGRDNVWSTRRCLWRQVEGCTSCLVGISHV